VTTFRWIIYPSTAAELYAIADEFVVEGCRLRVGGNSIEVEADDEAKAYDLASRYLALLQKHLPIAARLVSEAEYSEYLAEVIKVAAGRVDRPRVREAMRTIRNELLASADPALCRVYDYLQAARTARDNDGSPMPDLYKVIETIENALGGEANAIKVLGPDAGRALKPVKRAANEPGRDERHAPDDPTQPRVPADHGRAREDALIVVRSYEEYLRTRPGR